MKRVLLSFLKISCKEATFYMIKNEEGKLSFFHRVKLNFHTSMCAVCKRFEEQSATITRLGRQIQTKDHLSDAARNKIERVLDEYSF